MKSNSLSYKKGGIPFNKELLNYNIPPDSRLNDFFIDGPQLISELFISKRTLHNWRATGRISYTNSFGKIFYFKQEIVKAMFDGKINRRGSG